VAALGKMVGRGLDVLLDAWAAAPTPAGLEGVRASLDEATGLFKQACDKLHAAERDAADYLGADLMDMAAAVVNTWLLARDAGVGADQAARERKAALARAYAAEHLPKAMASGRIVLAAELTAVTAKESILA
jgi:uncharacterized membrane protein